MRPRRVVEFVQPFVLFFLLLNVGANGGLFVGSNTGLPLTASRDASS